jgi:hypothetical protein
MLHRTAFVPILVPMTAGGGHGPVAAELVGILRNVRRRRRRCVLRIRRPASGHASACMHHRVGSVKPAPQVEPARQVAAPARRNGFADASTDGCVAGWLTVATSGGGAFPLEPEPPPPPQLVRAPPRGTSSHRPLDAVHVSNAL